MCSSRYRSVSVFDRTLRRCCPTWADMLPIVARSAQRSSPVPLPRTRRLTDHSISMFGKLARELASRPLDCYGLAEHAASASMPPTAEPKTRPLIIVVCGIGAVRVCRIRDRIPSPS